MAQARTARSKRGANSDLTAVLGLAIVILFFIGSGFVSYSNTSDMNKNAVLVTRTHETLIATMDFMSAIKDAETGQRGYVMTGRNDYLAPYTNAVIAVSERFEKLKQLTSTNVQQQTLLDSMKTHVDAKMTELAETVELRKVRGFDAALAVVETNRGKSDMDSIRDLMRQVQDIERTLRQQRLDQMKVAYRTALGSGFLSALLGVIISLFVGILLQRAANVRDKQQWLQNGEIGVSNAMVGDIKIEHLGDNVLKFLAEYFDAHAGAFFINEGGYFRRIATYGVPSNSDTPERFTVGDNLLGQAVKDKQTFIIHDVPPGYLHFGSALGQGVPRHLIISPAGADGIINTVIELGFVHDIEEDAVALFERISESIGIAVRSAHMRAELQNFLEETQRQAEELQAQSEELRVSNEELEEQARALKESQTRLEQQQAEMEQTNAQLEEQTQMLETQRNDLEKANIAVSTKAQELEQASQYKSDFLANMSHELRTPLNSSLILSKLLADNAQGNLTKEQVKFAQTIQSAGNDLLSLINDILDLSKIESGHMDISTEHVMLTRLCNDLRRTFEPIAKQKNLELNIEVAQGCPDALETDRQRLEQVLKNLLSNALKFTDKGKVDLTIQKSDGCIAFEVKDTGIGISEEQQKIIFEAFRQADGTISRKFGGTGLGLSISRELTRLLGGMITLKSTPGKGSTFTISLPETYDATQIAPRRIPLAPVAEHSKEKKPARVASVRRAVEDDREYLSGANRMILVVEDDESFARILYDLAQEQNFQCVIASTAEEALNAARQYLPQAIVLDVGLPDNSGLSVLDRLKHDPRTRHIPVHVVSGNDYAQKAFALGAAGYMLKPVKREELAHAFKQLETKFSQRLRRVLIVEDDPVQQDSVRKLLGTQNVETMGASSAAECLEKLKDTSFDCMVLDLSLPDATGYSLLETLSKQEAYSFPPVIVYTGRDISADDEQKLRRYSKSIIIKGAKSPERLLDEVTLFLHQVVSELPDEQQQMLKQAHNRDSALEGRRILVVEDDARNLYSVTNIFEPLGAIIEVARNGLEALDTLEKSKSDPSKAIDLVLMDVMMPEMDGLTATRQIRKQAEWKKLPIIMLTAKAMRDDQERCLDAGANDYMAKPLDVEKLLSLVRVWMPR